ncbi:stewaprin-a-like [Pleurodeles waltl]|uniref:stewaprin-a-like n=1 Tax=Pleurodeles waltl TaxID=8319 RepID=UPI003709B6B9
MMKTPGAILLLAVLLGSYKALPVEGENLPEAKPGVCPTVINTCMIIPLPRTCNRDSDCVGVKKCCQYGCGFGCRDPVTDSSIPA